MLSVSLLPDLVLSLPSVAFVANGELIIFTGFMQMTRWKIEAEPYFRLFTTDRGYCSLHPPLIMGTEVYIANGLKVEKWSLETIASFRFLSNRPTE